MSDNPYLPGTSPDISFGKIYKFLREVRAEYTWMAGNAYSEFGFNQIDLAASFALPVTYDPQHPLLVTPGFTTYFLTSPDTAAGGPAELYDAYLDGQWNPQFAPWLGAELGVRVGVYSDFENVVGDSIRITGRGEAVFNFSPAFQVKAGILYLDRDLIKMLPAGGIVWTPNSDVRFDLLFPDPKISHRLWGTGTVDWWIYARGEYGGDDWTMSGHWTPNGFLSGPIQRVDYNDIRVALGVEFTRYGGMKGNLEVGGAFDRQIYTTAGITDSPGSVVFLRGGLAF